MPPHSNQPAFRPRSPMKVSAAIVRQGILITLVALALLLGICAALLKIRGFRASSSPSAFEVTLARTVRNFAIPATERSRTNPLAHDAASLHLAREDFLARCASCHGVDARGSTPVGSNVYPRVPDLRLDATQKLTDGQLHY